MVFIKSHVLFFHEDNARVTRSLSVTWKLLSVVLYLHKCIM